MLLSTLTTTGQATIPAEVRHALNLKPGDKLIFEMQDHQAVITKAKPLEYLYHIGVCLTPNFVALHRSVRRGRPRAYP